MVRWTFPLLLVACAGPEEPTDRSLPVDDTGLADDTARADGTDDAETDASSDTDDSGLRDTDPVDTAPAGDVVCFPGDGGAPPCYPVVPFDPAWGPDWAYPASSDPRYPAPTHFFDLDALDLDLRLVPNFQAGELMQRRKGRWGVLQPHLLVRLQALRDRVGGPVYVNSGYRGPAYNESVGGARLSRHMWGDAADLRADGVDLTTLGSWCEDLGAGYVGYYAGHVHCDWRDDALDPVLFRSTVMPLHPVEAPRAVSAQLAVRDGVWTAPATGWDEGEPLREWTARGADGAVLATARGATFSPPPGTATVSVWVGREVRVAAEAE